MLKQTFENFLQDIHAELYPQLLDDDMPDHFDNWLGELDVSEYIEYADFYGRDMFIKGKEAILTPTK